MCVDIYYLHTLTGCAAVGAGRGRDNEDVDWAGICIWNIYFIIFYVYWIHGDIGQLFYIDKYSVPAPPRAALLRSDLPPPEKQDHGPRNF